MHKLPAIGYGRLCDIIGDRKADPPIPAVIPVSKSTWWQGVKTGRFPAPVKIGPGITAWRSVWLAHSSGGSLRAACSRRPG